MKKYFILSAFCLLTGLALIAQTPPPPPNDPSNGGTNGPVGGGAPIGEGIVVLSVLAAAYGAKKMINKTQVLKR